MTRNETLTLPETLNRPEELVAYEQDFAIQALFAEKLEGVRKHKIQTLPDLTPAIDQRGRRIEGLDEKIPQGLFLEESFMASHFPNGQLPDRLSFTPQPVLRMGREISRRGVGFGKWTMEWFSTGQVSEIQVAVKPFKNDFERMIGVHEVAMYQQLRKPEINLPTLEPVGLLKAENAGRETLFAITKFMPSLMTFDNLPWHEFDDETRRVYLDKAVDVLAMLHGELLFHGDFELKNVGMRDIQGETAIIDTEEMMSCRGIDENGNVDERRIKQLMSADFSGFLLSVDQFIIKHLPERPQTAAERFDIDLQYVFVPYVDKLYHSKSPYRDQLLQTIKAVIDDKSRQALGEW